MHQAAAAAFGDFDIVLEGIPHIRFHLDVAGFDFDASCVSFHFAMLTQSTALTCLREASQNTGASNVIPLSGCVIQKF